MMQWAGLFCVLLCCVCTLSLVVDEEDGYEARPDWAKAVNAGRSGGDQSSSDTDILSDLQEEALYIPRSRLKDFSVIGEGKVLMEVCECLVSAKLMNLVFLYRSVW